MRKYFYLFVITILLCPTISFAETFVPKLVNLQAVLVDDGGNVLIDRQQATISFAVIDGAGDVLYEEIQPDVPIIHGAISVLVGSGNDVSNGSPTGGIPYDVFSSDGDKLLRLKLADQSVPQEDLQLVSVPYAFVAESLAQPIDSAQIKDASIMLADLNSEVLDAINQGGVAPALPSAKSISIAPGHLTYAAGNDVQAALEGFDNTMAIQVSRIEKLEEQAGNYVNKAGDEMSGTLTMDRTNIVMKDPQGCTPGVNCNTVDGVDVSKLKQDFENSKNDANDPSFNSVQITGTAPNIPQKQTLYQSNLIVAWARVNSSPNADKACTTGALQADFNIKCVERLAKGTYRLTFEMPPVNPSGQNKPVTSYIVMGNSFEASRSISVFDTNEQDFTIEVRDIDKEPDLTDLPFMVTVVGWAR